MAMDRKKLIWIISGSIILLLTGWWMWRTFQPEPHAPKIHSSDDIGGPTPADMQRAAEAEAARQKEHADEAERALRQGTPPGTGTSTGGSTSSGSGTTGGSGG